MELKKITLNNIRSYENEVIDFPKGSTLLSGDIGSGKTSILLAIEFALFGLQPGQRGTALLKNGINNGGVEVNFSIDNSEVVIKRNLKRGKSITQDYCSMTVDGEKKEMSVTELKDKVLDLLSYPKEFAKKQNLLYKFTVYTPQEEMKQIILQDAETRTNTLRHVFGIDKYKKILENLTILVQKVREDKKIKLVLTQSLESEKGELSKKEEELEAKHYNVGSVEKELFLKKEAKKRVEESIKELLEKIEEKRNLEKELEKTKIMLANKRETLSGNNNLIERVKFQISELGSLQFDSDKELSIGLEIQKLNKERIELREKNLDAASKMSSLSLKNQEAELVREKLRNLEICPTCLQDVDASYRANVSNKLHSDVANNVKQIEELSLEKKSIDDKINLTETQISNKEKELQDLKILKLKLEDLEEKKGRITELEKNNSQIDKDIIILHDQVETLQKSIFDFGKYDNLYSEKQKDLNFALDEERTAEIKVAELKKEIEVFTLQINELKERIKKTDILKKELDHLINLETWLSKKFSPLISFVEKNVMVKLKAEFSNVFSKWFSMLVSENFHVKLRDDFTPVIELQDYEIDYAYLSGGERTAVALAYRLALNQVINSLLSKIKTRDIVILDEPTDGFSDTQLDKMREVLEQLNVGQLIIVSHEQKIEGFVENVIKFKKEGGVSTKS